MGYGYHTKSAQRRTFFAMRKDKTGERKRQVPLCRRSNRT